MPRSFSLLAALIVALCVFNHSASAQELFGVHVVVVPQSDSPVRIRQINIGEGYGEGSPEIVLENLTGEPVRSIGISTWMAQPKNCYDESRAPRNPQYYTVLLNQPLAPHSTSSVWYGNINFLRPDLPLRDLTLHAPTPTVGYLHWQVALESVSTEERTWNRKQIRNGKAVPPYDVNLYRKDRPDCNQWQAVVPRLKNMVGTDIFLREPSELTETGAGILTSGESGYVYTCAYVQKPDGSAFLCPNLSAPPKAHSAKK